MIEFLEIFLFGQNNVQIAAEPISMGAAALISGRVEAKRQPALFSIAKGNITSALRSGIQILKVTVDPLLDHQRS